MPDLGTKFGNRFHEKYLHKKFKIAYYIILDDVLWIDSSTAILTEAFRSPEHKTFFYSFILGCHRTLTLPGRFGMAGLKLGWKGETAGQS